MQVFIPFLDNGRIIAGAVVGGIVGIVGIVLITIAVFVLVWCCIKKGKFFGLLNQVTRFAFMRCARDILSLYRLLLIQNCMQDTTA